ncbi:hypothetical protein GTZ99_08875 [Novosphingobium sp. FSY-8]|uniref:Transporter n=1 Tax=Novosphingobium ovatum TaxID=1908523 RepID=A0ABW9XDR1_9SPHN|nr:hypothetical protein [Novosphingobium ovatum]NBC36670.1 hypothetical protein [Novosphingobium ovatum]
MLPSFHFRSVLGVIAAFGLSSPAYAGPPFVTDDPQPTEYHRWEVYQFASLSREDGVTGLDTGLDLNYGAIKDLQLTATLPLHRETGAPLDVGEVQLAAKYRILHQGGGHLPIDVSLFPRVILPTGRGAGRARVLLPVWGQRNQGRWQFFGGGGYVLNPGEGNRNYWVQGAAVMRQMRPGWQLGIEEYHQGPTAQGERAVTGLNLGTLIHIKGPVSLIGSAGQGLNRRQSLFYAALKLDL